MFLVIQKDANDVIFASEVTTVKKLIEFLPKKYEGTKTVLILNCKECGSPGLFKSKKKGR
jgi:hypothetical protein